MAKIPGLKESPAAKEWKLNYRIVGRTNQNVQDSNGNVISMDCVHVEWTHSGGPVMDKVLLPQNHPPITPDMPPIEYKEVDAGTREVICDQINVKEGTPDSVIMSMLEEKRQRLADALGLES